MFTVSGQFQKLPWWGYFSRLNTVVLTMWSQNNYLVLGDMGFGTPTGAWGQLPAQYSDLLPVMTRSDLSHTKHMLHPLSYLCSPNKYVLKYSFLLSPFSVMSMQAFSPSHYICYKNGVKNKDSWCLCFKELDPEFCLRFHLFYLEHHMELKAPTGCSSIYKEWLWSLRQELSFMPKVAGWDNQCWGQLSTMAQPSNHEQVFLVKCLLWH